MRYGSVSKTRWHFRWGWCWIRSKAGTYVLRHWLFEFSSYPSQVFVRLCGFYFEWLNCRALLQCDRCRWVSSAYVGHAALDLSVDDTLAAIERATSPSSKRRRRN